MRGSRARRSVGADRFQAPFADLLAPALLADGRVSGVGAEERPGAGQAEAALAVLADVPRAGRESVIILRMIHTPRDWPAEEWPQ